MTRDFRKQQGERFSWRKWARGFGYALAGIKRLLLREHNAWLHCGAAFAAICCGCLVGLSATEWVAVVLCIGGVLAAEAFNTAVEVLADRVSPEADEAIGRCKDLAAGAVLLMAAAAMFAGGLVFLPKIISLL